jgi:dTMP kinase
MTELGFGAAFGVVTLLWLQGRLPRITVFCFAVIGTGVFLVFAASFSALAPAALMIGAVGACAGTTYVTGFTVLQESVPDEFRGRIFAALYTVVRLCLLIALTISPLWSDFWDWLTRELFGGDQSISIGPYTYALPGVRIALWGGGIITFVAGLFAWRSIRRAERNAAETGEPTVAEEGPIAPIRPLGLVEPSPIAEPDARDRDTDADADRESDAPPEAGAGP